ncbi:DUF2252 domain-containing protein [Geodermatophilus aquaeductus]|uniref:Uncharacterized conserved protein, DUF2252 family n=1 Tax=Geodermatophilus aquaeductus TaxID=1564161 RepID=A0A521BZ54_9ACTN|nr:DUF2252 domain-containing protein [Geodermatophilus aquaeductus]SMO52459.1 Uncharacterized conserved protein, DUF2252 family [Geodermatophilus aquaeductus]
MPSAAADEVASSLPVGAGDQRSRRAAGRAARERAPRRDVGREDPEDRGRDALAVLLAQNAIRAEDLLPVRNGRMAASPWTYYRGAAAVMAADLGSRPHSGLVVQLCGDAHLLNFGLWATPERNLSFDLRDFDETLPGPFEWDVARLVASVVVLARTHGVSAGGAEEAVAACLRAYRERMSGYAAARWLDVWYDLVTVDRFLGVFSEPDRIRGAAHIERRARKRTHRGAFRKLTEHRGGHLRITEDPPIRQHRDDGLAEELFAAYRDSLADERRHLLDRFTLVDTVRQVVGVGSVGMRVHLLLLEGRDGGDPLFLQIKQAGASVYEPFCGPSRYGGHGRRVVEGKRLVQSATDVFVGWAAARGHDYYVRQFRDMKVVADGALVAPRLREFATACGAVLARSHARTGDPVAITAYIGRGRAFDEGMGTFADAYADRTERDHRRLVDALASGRLPSAPGW